MHCIPDVVQDARSVPVAPLLNPALLRSYHWLDEDTIVTLVLPQGRGDPPVKPPAPIGPTVSSNLEGAVSQARTYQDLLKDAYDEELFEWHGTSEIAIVQVKTPWLKVEPCAVGIRRLQLTWHRIGRS